LVPTSFPPCRITHIEALLYIFFLPSRFVFISLAACSFNLFFLIARKLDQIFFYQHQVGWEVLFHCVFCISGGVASLLRFVAFLLFEICQLYRDPFYYMLSCRTSADTSLLMSTLTSPPVVITVYYFPIFGVSFFCSVLSFWFGSFFFFRPPAYVFDGSAFLRRRSWVTTSSSRLPRWFVENRSSP